MDGSDKMEVLRGRGKENVPSIAVNYDTKRICWVLTSKRPGIIVSDNYILRLMVSARN